VPEGAPDDRFVYLSDVLPTAWQAVAYADIPKGGSVAVYGLGPIGQMCTRIARHLGAERAFGIDLVPERLTTARQHGTEVVDARQTKDVPGYLQDATDGRGPDAVIDAVGMESHGDPFAKVGQQMATLLPDVLAEPLVKNLGLDRMGALIDSIKTVRRGGTVSLSGVYGGSIDPLPMVDQRHHAAGTRRCRSVGYRKPRYPSSTAGPGATRL
jgi:threonine dehydrogenase-like Zn-dependent dehydrogenase